MRSGRRAFQLRAVASWRSPKMLQKSFISSDNNKMKPNGGECDVPRAETTPPAEWQEYLRRGNEQRKFSTSFYSILKVVTVTRMRDCEFFSPSQRRGSPMFGVVGSSRGPPLFVLLQNDFDPNRRRWKFEIRILKIYEAETISLTSGFSGCRGEHK